MLTEEILLLVPSVVLVTGILSYIFFREKMLKKPVSERNHSRKRVVKVTAINFFLNLVAALYFSLFLFLVLQRKGVTYNSPVMISLLAAYLITICITFYGNGIYITSILLEDFTPSDLRLVKSFETQFIATHLFHGPISHILIYSGWMIVFLILAVIDMLWNLSSVSSNFPVLIIAGGVTGFFFALSQIYNGTAIYQYFTSTVIVIVFTTFLLMNDGNFSTAPIASFYYGLIAVFEIIIGSYLTLLAVFKLENKNIHWDKSGGSGEKMPGEKILDRLLRY
jgi:hypothetical protein